MLRPVVRTMSVAGHESYLKTTIAGLTGSHPDFALIIINSLAGVTRMTREHLVRNNAARHTATRGTS